MTVRRHGAAITVSTISTLKRVDLQKDSLERILLHFTECCHSLERLRRDLRVRAMRISPFQDGTDSVYCCAFCTLSCRSFTSYLQY